MPPRLLPLLLACLAGPAQASFNFNWRGGQGSMPSFESVCIDSQLREPAEARVTLRLASGATQTHLLQLPPSRQTCLQEPFGTAAIEVLAAGRRLCALNDVRGPIAVVRVEAGPAGSARCAG